MTAFGQQGIPPSGELVIEAAVREGDLELLDVWLTKANIPGSEKLSSTLHGYAVDYKRLDVLQWGLTHRKLHARGPQATKAWLKEHNTIKETMGKVKRMTAAMDIASSAGYYEALQWAHSNLPDRCSPVALANAVINGHESLADWLYENYAPGYFEPPADGCSNVFTAEWFLNTYEWTDLTAKDTWINKSIEYAAHHNLLDVVKCLYKAHPSANPSRAIDAAAAQGHFTMVRRLHHNQATATTDAMDNAAANGHLEIVQWLHVNRTEGCTTKAMDRAAAANNMSLLQWLYENRSEGCTSDAVDAAAGNGNLEMVQWLLEHTEYVCCTAKGIGEASSSGQIEVLTWLNTNAQNVGALPMVVANVSRVVQVISAGWST